MASHHDLYGSGTSHHNVFTTNSSRKELDMRQEMSRTLFGAVDEIAKGRTGMLRRMREDSDGNPIKCPCRDTITDEPDKDYYCRVCLGHGFLWDEEEIVYYRDNDSTRRYKETFFYVEYGVEPKDGDYIVEIKLDLSGKPVTPVQRSNFYRVDTADAFRSDEGRVEFWRCRTKLEREWSVWYGVQNRQHDPSTGS
jgi:hypothetical protein